MRNTLRDTIGTLTAPRVLGAGYRRTLEFLCLRSLCLEIREIRTVELCSNRGCLVRGNLDRLNTSLSCRCLTRTPDDFEDTMRTDCCQKFETFVTTSQRKCHFRLPHPSRSPDSEANCVAERPSHCQSDPQISVNRCIVR